MVETIVNKTATKGIQKPKRKPSTYNIFMKKAIAQIKESNPTLIHKDIFKMAAAEVIYNIAIAYEF